MSEYIDKPRFYEAGSTRTYEFKDFRSFNQALERAEKIEDFVCKSDQLTYTITIVTSRGLTTAELEARLRQIFS